MNVKILVTGAAIAALAAGAAYSQATPAAGSTDTSSPMSAPKDASATAGTEKVAKHTAHHKRMASNERRASRSQYAAPDQPIPYAQLDQYLKSTPKERMAMTQASTGTTADTSATAPAASTPDTTPH
ncbi:MAG TPA: hypothetical protein VK801_10700 [Caulobacteraceae bacterium]|jgi:hypothetical protein|nr:hypothetical protein [Caulobacteraceae bacterium]